MLDSNVMHHVRATVLDSLAVSNFPLPSDIVSEHYFVILYNYVVIMYPRELELEMRADLTCPQEIIYLRHP